VLKLLLAVALLAVGAFVLLDRDAGDGLLPGGGDDAPRSEGRDGGRDGGGDERPLRPVRCPPRADGCESVTGRIVFVERVDPDGDGDLHVVIADGSISLPGLTAVDVKPSLRPRRDPGVGDRATAAGPVQTGTYGQSQIHALRFRVQR
jgi:hypothetical protein